MTLSPRIRKVAAALLFIALGLLLTRRYHSVIESQAPPPLVWYDRAVVFVVSPPVRLLAAFRDRVKSSMRRYLFLAGVAEENDRLRQAMEAAALERTLLGSVREENDRLRSLLDLRPAFEGSTVAARVTAIPPLGDFRTIRINKGSEEGVRRRDAVIAVGGLVGQVARVERHASQVLLITDPTSAVDARVIRTGARGLIVGRARRLEIRHELFIGAFEFLASTAAIEKGDAVETTGLDGIFPPGIPIGTVHEVTRRSHEVFLESEVVPHVEFHNLREVLVLTKR